MNDLISIARVGRSLGMHLILSTQKPAGIVNEQIWANTNFKICMKVANRQDSMEVLHHDDASRLTGPGSFILLKDGNRMIRGTAAYAHAESSIRQVVCFDQELRPLANETSGTFQSAELIDSIHQIKTVHPAGQLWKEPVKELSWQMFDDTGGCPIGVIDDIHASAYRLFVLQEKNLYVISMDHQEKERFLMTVLTALLKVRPARMITVIDDLHFSFLKDISDSGRINLLDSSEEEGIISLIQAQKHMKDKLHVLIITDISTFLNAYGHRFPIDNWLGYPRENHMQLILMGINTSALPYKYLSLIPLRCTLKNENSQDIASLFEKGGRYAAHKAGYGLVNDRWGSTFRLIHTRKEDLKEALDVRTDSDLSLFSAGK